MPSTSPRKGFLDLPPEIRNAIYGLLFPCINDHDDFCNPILSRRLGRAMEGGSFICYRCHGEALLYVCRQMRAEVLPIYCSAHEFRFQLWKDHKVAIEAWILAMSDEAIAGVRRFRMNAQFLGEQGDTARSNPTSIVFPMPGYVRVNLDAGDVDAMVETSNTWTKHLLAEPSRQIHDIVTALPQVDDKVTLTKDALSKMIDAVGWFGFRNAKEREIVDERSLARKSLAKSQAAYANPL